VAKADRDALEKVVKDMYPEGYKNIEEMVRWRLYNRTGGGLMAELGSHQLDACSIFLDAMGRAGTSDMDEGPHRDTVGQIREKVHPLAVSGVGMRTPLFQQEGWEVDDQVFCSFEFPGKKYWADWKTGKVNMAEDTVLVTYSSINTNGFEPYGECVMGSRGTMIVDREQSIMLFPEGGARATAVGVSTAAGGKPVLDTSSSTGGPSAALDAGQKSLGAGTVSRGYREEMEDFAYCIRMWDQMDKNARPLPRCHGQVAMGDAIIALTSNQAMAGRKRIEFRPEWFDPKQMDQVPDADRVVENVKGKGFAEGLYKS
jgi:predicted dehydrogenase